MTCTPKLPCSLGVQEQNVKPLLTLEPSIEITSPLIVVRELNIVLFDFSLISFMSVTVIISLLGRQIKKKAVLSRMRKYIRMHHENRE